MRTGALWIGALLAAEACAVSYRPTADADGGSDAQAPLADGGADALDAASTPCGTPVFTSRLDTLDPALSIFAMGRGSVTIDTTSFQSTPSSLLAQIAAVPDAGAPGTMPNTATVVYRFPRTLEKCVYVEFAVRADLNPAVNATVMRLSGDRGAGRFQQVIVQRLVSGELRAYANDDTTYHGDIGFPMVSPSEFRSIVVRVDAEPTGDRVRVFTRGEEKELRVPSFAAQSMTVALGAEVLGVYPENARFHVDDLWFAID